MTTIKLFLTRKEHDLLMDKNKVLFDKLMKAKHTWSVSGPDWSEIDSTLAKEVVITVCPDVLTINL